MGNSSSSGLPHDQRFSMYMNALKQRGCSEFVIASFMAVKEKTLDFASKITINPNNIPFLPVIGPTYHTIYNLMLMVRNVREIGFTRLNAAKISNLYEARYPFDPGLSFIFDVDTGDALRFVDPFAAHDRIMREKRTPFNIFEAISLCAHTNTLEHHNIWALRSFYGLVDGVEVDREHCKILVIYLGNGVKPTLGYMTPASYRQYNIEVQPNKFGAPSYAHRRSVILS